MGARRVLVASVLLAGCSSGGDESVSTTTPPPPSSTVPVTATPSTTEAPGRRFEDGPLADVCPSTIVVQTDGLPSVRLGPLYALVADAAIDDAAQVVTGPLRRPDGTVEDVTLQLRSGGPSVGFRSSLAVVEADPAVHLATTSFAELAVDPASSAVAVAALAGTSDAMIMWDPERYPEIVDLDTLGSSGIEVRYVEGELVIDFLVADGVLEAGQVVGGAENAIAGFVTSAGSIARQGDALIDPVLFPALPQWGRPIDFAAASTRGWLDVDPVVAVVVGRLEDDCLGRLVPLFQGALVAYDTDPAPTNEIMAAARNRFTPLNRVTSGLLDMAAERPESDVALLDEFDDVVGGFDLGRLDTFVPALAEALGTDVRPVDELIDDRFLDPER